MHRMHPHSSIHGHRRLGPSLFASEEKDPVTNTILYDTVKQNKRSRTPYLRFVCICGTDLCIITASPFRKNYQ
jgi:hypothetical protein